MTDRRRVAAALALAALVVACRKEAPSTATPDASPPPDAAAAVVEDPLDGPERALADNATRLRALGVTLESPERDDERNRKATVPPKTTTDDVKGDPDTEPSSTKPTTKNVEPAANATRCTELCGLADTACELRTQICGLADEHVGESRYEAACWRANDQCTRASAACDDCKGAAAGAAGSCNAG